VPKTTAFSAAIAPVVKNLPGKKQPQQLEYFDAPNMATTSITLSDGSMIFCHAGQKQSPHVNCHAGLC
jgi:hypothetical protein